MKLNNKVDRMELNINPYTYGTEEMLVVRFDVDFEFSQDESSDKQSFCVTFNKDGIIDNFPDIKFNSKNPIRYVVLGDVVKEIMSYEGERAKKTYNKAMDIIKAHEEQKDTLINDTNYNDLKKNRILLTSAIDSKRDEFKRARNANRKSALEHELNSLLEEERALNNEHISPIEQKLNQIEFHKRKAISELIM